MQAGDGQAEFGRASGRVVTGQVTQLDPLELLPNAFVRVQLGRIAAAALQQESFALLRSQEGFDRLRPVDRRPFTNGILTRLSPQIGVQIYRESDEHAEMGWWRHRGSNIELAY